MDIQFILKKFKTAPTLIFVITLLIYFLTLSQGLSSGDSSELALAIQYLGLPHPTGFPTYMLVAKVWTMIFPFGELIFKLNVLSALFASATVSLLYSILARLQIPRFIALTVCLTLAFGFRFWFLTTLVHPYFITMFFFALSIYFLILLDQQEKYKYIHFIYLVFALGLGTHTIFLTILPFIIIYLIIINRKMFLSKTTLLAIFFSFITTAMLYSYIPLRAWANPVLGWDHPDTIPKIIDYLRQKDYAYKIANLNWSDMVIRLQLVWENIVREWTIFGFALAILGISATYIKNKKIFFSGIVAIILNILLMLVYGNDADRVVIYRYLLPSFFIGMIFFAYTLDRMTMYAKKIMVLFFAMPLMLISMNYPKNNMKQNFLIEDFANNIFQSATNNSIIITKGDIATMPLWYYQKILKKYQGILVIDANLVPVFWYAKDLSQKYPDLVSEQLPNIEYTERLRYLANMLIAKKEVFMLGGEKLSGNYKIIPHGILNQILPAEATTDINQIKQTNEKLWNNFTLRILQKNWEEIDPFVGELITTYSKTLNNLGVYYAKNNLIDDAVRVMKKSLSYNPKNKTAIENLQNYYLSIGDATQAEYYKKLLTD